MTLPKALINMKRQRCKVILSAEFLIAKAGNNPSAHFG